MENFLEYENSNTSEDFLESYNCQGNYNLLQQSEANRTLRYGMNPFP